MHENVNIPAKASEDSPGRSTKHQGIKRILGIGLLLAALPGLMALPAIAREATVATLTETGSAPGVTVGSDGTVHAVWDDPSDPHDYVTYYCRMPSATAGCTNPVKLETQPGYQYFSRPRAFLLSANAVLVVASRTGSNQPFSTPAGSQPSVVFSFLSTDGGKTFSEAKMIGTAQASGDMITDGKNVYIISDQVTGGTFFQAAPLSGFTTTRINLSPNSLQSYYGALALYEGDERTKLVAVFGDLKTLFYRVWSGSGDPNDLATWGPLQELDSGEDSEMAHGPAGTFVMYKKFGATTADGHYVVRRFNGEGFDAPVVVGDRMRTLSAGDFSQEANGRLHFVRYQNSVGLVHRSSMDGVRWTARSTVLNMDEFGSSGRHPVVDAGGSRAAVLWTTSGSTASLKKVHSAAASGRCTMALQGTEGGDTITGTAAGETIFGLGGDDTLNGGAGSDCVRGDAGNDVLAGGGAKDALYGGGGNDRIEARDGTRDVVNCGGGTRDIAVVDKLDRVDGCEKVSRN